MKVANDSVSQQKIKVIVSDVDKTLTSNNTWYELTKAFNGSVEKHFELYSAFLKGETPEDELTTGLIAMLEKAHGKKIQRAELEDILFKIPLKSEAFAVFNDLQQQGYTVCLISGSMDIFVKLVAKRLNVQHWFANSIFEFDKDDNWVNFRYNPREAELKLKQLQDFLKAEKIADSECLVLGDGKNDRELFKHYRGVAIDNEDEELSRLAWKEIKYLPTLLQVLTSLEK